MKAYNDANKIGALEFQYDNGFFGDDVAKPLSNDYDTAEKISLSGIIEFYVIGKDFSWVYIVTHEGDECGPYFVIKN